MALPGTGTTFNQFRVADAECRDFARSRINGAGVNDAAVHPGVKSAALGATVGAVAGAALGGRGRDAAMGAGAGLLLGTLIGAGAAKDSQIDTQQVYDHGYVQCMYGKGQRVPVTGTIQSAYQPPSLPPPPLR